ncbi:HLA class II histocompatibility antigen, DP beta 1 chain-like [Tenrec ecaudatus]|uniref:HLA class II histocompatibility antigen, DP beta 1 chain-like n=1 Tax=Tenrec ecaudatus TaxID=94439 RepID=UPI003F596CDD
MGIPEHCMVLMWKLYKDQEVVVLTEAGNPSVSRERWSQECGHQGIAWPASSDPLLSTELYVCRGDANADFFLERNIYNREEYIQFHSHVGLLQAVTELAQPAVKNRNIRKKFLELRPHAVDLACIHNQSWTRVPPKMNISPSKMGTLQHHSLLVCHITGFYPSTIQACWLRNHQEETAEVLSTELIHNEDWPFQMLVMLEIVPQQGDIYVCHVDHSSLDSPVTMEWKAQSDSAQSKMLTRVGGFVLGLIFLIRKSKEAPEKTQNDTRRPTNRPE